MTIAINTGNVGGIDDYSSLVDAIRLWLDRGSDLDVQIPTFIALIEPYLNRVLRAPDMEAMAGLVIPQDQVLLPEDCLEIRSVTYNGSTLYSMSPSALLTAFTDSAGSVVSGFPTGYSVSGRQITIAPSAAGTIMLSYWQRIPSLTISQPTNWLLTAYPDIYLYGALAQAEGYIENPERAAQWTGLFTDAVESLREANNKARFGGPIRARTVAQVRGCRA